MANNVFKTISEFKKLSGHASFELKLRTEYEKDAKGNYIYLKNGDRVPKTHKDGTPVEHFSVLADDGISWYRCQQHQYNEETDKLEKAFDPEGPLCWLIPDGELDDACLINYDDSKGTMETVATL